MRVRLLKKWKHPLKRKESKPGVIFDLAPYYAAELMADKIAEVYNGSYPPKREDKLRIKLNNL